ncbi:helix-turn-helix domain-containing protein [Streptomyces griseofuscus]|uniref:helix-turn-helix domain-containing protein n=1 Tax=Streptomyces griseofuscus TaxID=146922 RepID=UPI00380E14B5
MCELAYAHPSTVRCVPATPCAVCISWYPLLPELYHRVVKTSGEDQLRVGGAQDPLPDWVPHRRQQIGAQIREARRRARLSQMQLGERIGRDHKTISRWENGHHPPDLNDLLLIADALDVPLADLVR